MRNHTQVNLTALLPLAIAVVAGLTTGCSSSTTTQQTAALPYYAGGPKPMTAIQSAEANTYANYHAAAPAYSNPAAAAPVDGRAEYEAFVNAQSGH